MRKPNLLAIFFYKTVLIVAIGLSSQACNSCSEPMTRLGDIPQEPVNKIFIVCSHGIGEVSTDMQPWIDSFIKEDLGGPITAIAIGRPDSKTSPLEDQAKALQAKILEEARKRDLCSSNSQWFLVGNSQGGVIQLLAYLSMDEPTKKFVRGLISRNSPLCGAPGVKPDPEQLVGIDNAIQLVIPDFSIKSQVLAPLLGDGVGSTDLDPASPVIQKIKTAPSTDAPLLCLSGDLGGSDILDFFLDLIRADYLKSNSLYSSFKSFLITTLDGIIGPNNDGLVPRSSQEGQGIQNTNKVVKYFPGSNHFATFPGSEPYKAAVAFIKEQVKTNANK